MKTTIGILLVTLPYSYRRGKVIYYQRAIPGDLQERCGAKRVKVKLDTQSITTAARQIVTINRRVEADWAALRASPEAVPSTIRGQAVELLKDWGLSPSPAANDDDSVSAFQDFLDAKRERHAGPDEEAYREAHPRDYLAPQEIDAAMLLGGTVKPRLTEALELYLSTHPKRGNPSFSSYSRKSFERLTQAIGDKLIDEVSRADGHSFVAAMMKQGLASASIRRQLNAVRAIMAAYIREKELNRKNPFSEIPIPEEGEDTVDAVPYTPAELQRLSTACREADDSRRWLIAMVLDTGARLAEIAGLALSDIRLDAEVPHIVIQPHPWRSLKNANSERNVPLVGNSLWGAQRVKESATDEAVFAFTSYTDLGRTNSNSASSALNKWIKESVKLPHTIHELRHTMADRLRDVQCPQDIRLSIGGWSVKGVGEGYGQGYALKVKAEWLKKLTAAPN